MKSIHARAANTPRVTIRNGRGYWEPSASLRRAGFTGVPLGILTAEALNQADDLNAAADTHLEHETAQRSAPQTISAILDAFERSPEFKAKALRTQQDRRRYFRRARKDLGHFTAAQLTAFRMRGWHRDLSLASPSDAIGHITALRTAFSWAVDEGKMHNNPASLVKLPERSRRQRIGTRAELWAMVSALETLGLKSVAGCAITTVGTMQRIGDIRRLLTTNVQHGRLSITQAKTQTPLSFMLHSLIVDRIGCVNPRPAPLFASERTGKEWTERAFNRAWSEAREIAARSTPSLTGCDHSVTEHVYSGELRAADLRRTGMVWAAQHGATVAQICSASGHSIQEGMAILETYLPRHQILADQAIVRMDMVRTPSLEAMAGQLSVAM